MKNISTFAFLFLMIASGCAKGSPSSDMKDISVYSTSSLSIISFDGMIDGMKNSDVIFFGERHDDTFSHGMELEIFKKLHKKYKNIVLGMEMFERDVQAVLDSFMNGRIDDSAFMQRARAWNNYKTDYAPLVIYAKENGIDVFAANIPRSLASIVAKSGEDSLLSIESVKDLFNKPSLNTDDYKKLFFDFMKSAMPDGSGMSHMTNLEDLFMSQLYKDATMANSINNTLKKNEGAKVFFLCGEFHSNYRLGTVEQLSILNPSLSSSTVAVEDSMETADIYKADFLILKKGI